MRIRPVCPRTIILLPPHYVNRDAISPFDKADLSQQGADSSHRFACQQARIKNPSLIQRRITEANLIAGFFRSIKIVENKVAGRARKWQVFVARNYFGRLTECAHGEGRRYDGRRSPRREK